MIIIVHYRIVLINTFHMIITVTLEISNDYTVTLLISNDNYSNMPLYINIFSEAEICSESKKRIDINLLSCNPL